MKDFFLDLFLDREGEGQRQGQRCVTVFEIVVLMQLVMGWFLFLLLMLYLYGDNWCSDQIHPRLYSWYLALHRLI